MFLKALSVFLSVDALLILCMNALDFMGYYPIYRTDIMVGGVTTRSIGLVIFTLMAILILKMTYDILTEKTKRTTD